MTGYIYLGVLMYTMGWVAIFGESWIGLIAFPVSLLCFAVAMFEEKDLTKREKDLTDRVKKLEKDMFALTDVVGKEIDNVSKIIEILKGAEK